MSANAYTMTRKEALAKYLHQCLFIQTKKPLVKSVRNKQLNTWPELTVAVVQKIFLTCHPPQQRPHELAKKRYQIHNENIRHSFAQGKDKGWDRKYRYR